MDSSNSGVFKNHWPQFLDIMFVVIMCLVFKAPVGDEVNSLLIVEKCEGIDWLCGIFEE